MNDGKQGDIDEDDPNFSIEVLFLNMDYQDSTSCVSQDTSRDHDVTKPYEEENIEALHQKMVVMSSPLVYSLPYKFIDSLDTKPNSIGIILSSFDQKDEVCFSPICPFLFFSISLFNWCILCIIYLTRISMKDF